VAIVQIQKEVLNNMNLVDFNRLTVFNSKVYDIETISRVFPQYLINTFVSFLVVTEDNTWERLYKNGNNLFNFTISVGTSIKSNNFNSLSSLIIEYFEECYSLQKDIMYNVILDHNEKKNFTNICNGFEGKVWDDIIIILCSSLNTLSFSGKVNNIKLYGGS